MRKIICAAAVVVVMTTGLTACAPGNNTPGATVVGAASGALIGGALFRGSPVGMIASSLVGGALGYFVGRQMDQQDYMNMQNAVAETPIDEQASWTNPNTHIMYTVVPTRGYVVDGRNCREYTTRVTINGQMKKAFGRACQMPDGSWKIVK